ncbi:RNA polymerase-binding protein DksA [Piscinibacter terrae]|uniref:RNA polymerase-binding transcription factor DksA n=1 Tax=Piscinibacter terrae TaxID=2496871 RepID=A0A3N7JPK2_9BURK|nr:RNA polymerase-binding protein DksA [Albitalea terrae]RQP22989.1 RNA polymerase-binding protein DksA [Albitalea terrae]
MSKTPAAKQASAKKPAAKTPAAKATKPAAKTAPAKAAPKAAPAAPAKPAPKAAKPAAHHEPAKAAKPVAAAKPAPMPPPPPKPAPAHKHAEPELASVTAAAAPKRSSKAAAEPPATAPLPPPTSRFADRFAPPRPPTRQMNNLAVDIPKQAHKADPKLANAWKTKAGRDLTEAELLAMPDSEYMNEKQLDFFRAKLQVLKDDLLSNAGETTEHLREDTSIVPDPADRATIEEEHALELRTRDRERKLLKKISQSLARIDAGDYGFCDETGEPIGLGRLIARPTATLSLEAQQRRELKQKMFGD